MSGIADRAPARPGRDRLRDPGEERRRRRDLAREPVPGVPGRRPEPLLQLLVRADERVAAVLLHPVGAPRLLPRLCGRVRDPRARAVRDRGRRRPLARRPGAGDLTVRTADGATETVEAQALGERGRSAQPAQAARHPGPGALRRARRSTPPAGTRRSTSPASGWRSSAPARARHSSSPPWPRPPRQLTVFQRTPAVAARHAELPRRRSPTGCGGCSTTCRAFAQLGPHLDLLALARGARADGRGRRELGGRPSR